MFEEEDRIRREQMIEFWIEGTRLLAQVAAPILLAMLLWRHW